MTSAMQGPTTGGSVDPAAFVLLGGRASLDLVATLGRRHATPVERIPDPATLSDWFVAAGLFAVGPTVDEALLARARALREAINAVARSVLDRVPMPDAALAAVNAAAAQPDLAPQLTAEGTVGAVAAGGAQAGLASIARDAVHLFGGPQALRVKECEHPDCSLLFVDETQSRRRRWCSMSRCGNLVKTAGYRARRSGGAEGRTPDVSSARSPLR